MNPTRVAARLAEADSVAVVGLGRFGSAVATELVRSGVEVLGIDSDDDLVQEHSETLTHVVRVDSTSERALRQLAIPDFDRVVVGIGTNIEASLITASTIVDFGGPIVWAKAISAEHGRILERLGVQHVVFPESEMGRRVAHLVRGAMLDYLEVEENFSIVKTSIPGHLCGLNLQEAQIRAQHGVTVIAIKHGEADWTYATPETTLHPGDRIIVAGPTRKAEKFALVV